MVTLLKNQMKSAMMAKPADNIALSGNSRVKLTINGQVNRAIRIAKSGDETEISSVDNDGSSSRVTLHALGQANKNLKIGAHHVLEWQDNRRSATSAANEGNERVRTRNVEVWLDHKDLGQLWLGKGSIAADATDLLSQSGVSYVFGSAGVAADGVSSTGGDSRGWRLFSFFGARENRIMYVTPNVAGATLSASYSQNKSFSAAVQYAGAPPGVKSFSVLVKAGFRTDPNEHDDDAMATPGFDADDVYAKDGTPAVNAPASTAWGVSGGIMHNPSGFSLSGGYGAQRMKGMDAKPYNWYADIGWAGKVSDVGATAIGVGYFYSSDGKLGSAQQYWFAINQEIAAAASDIYAGVAFDSGSNTQAAMAAVAGADGAMEVSAMEHAVMGPGEVGFNTSGLNAEALAEKYKDGDMIEHEDLQEPDADTVYTYQAATALVPAGEATEGTPATPEQSVARDGVFVFLAGVRIKF